MSEPTLFLFEETAAERKAALRRQMRARRDAIGPTARLSAANRVSKKLSKRARPRGILAVYLATPRELSLAPFIERAHRHGWQLAAPTETGFARLNEKGELRGEVPVEEISLFLVPGLAFGRDGARLGQGGGWYDRVLAKRNAQSLVVGIAFDEQIVADLPREPHDIAIDYLCTPRDFICCKGTVDFDRTLEAHGH